MLVGFLQYCVRLLSEVENAITSIERIAEFSDLPSDPPFCVEERHRAPAGWPSEGAVTITGLAMRFRSDLPLTLRGVDLDIQAGEKIGVVGRTVSTL